MLTNVSQWHINILLYPVTNNTCNWQSTAHSNANAQTITLIALLALNIDTSKSLQTFQQIHEYINLNNL